MRLAIDDRLRFMTSRLKRRLNELLRAPDQEIMPHTMAIELSVSRADGLAIIAVLQAENLVESKLLIYHTCDPHVPAGFVPFGQGLPQLPWTCDLCDGIVEDYEDLSFDVQARTLVSIELV
jgi:hypothetical protein